MRKNHRLDLIYLPRVDGRTLVLLKQLGVVLRLHPLACLDGEFAALLDDSGQQCVCRSLLRIMVNCRIQVFEFVVPELLDDLPEQRDAGMVLWETLQLF